MIGRERDEAPVYFIGPLPPPTSGQSFATKLLLDACRDSGLPLVVLNTIRGSTASTSTNVLVRARRAAFAITKILLGRRGRSYYISVDANRGMAITCVYVAAARLRGGRIHLHHHTYGHISSPNILGRSLALLAGASANHICICPRMGDALRNQYPNVKRTTALSNIRFVKPPPIEELMLSRASQQIIRLGHMSRLSEAKGIIECITLLERLQKEGFTAHLHLAGSIEPDARKHIEAAIKKHGEKIILHGFVSGAEKDSFFREIDFFLFPTRYHNETQGIVNLEAMSFGVPVIAFDRCCIGSDAEGGGGLAIPPTDDYVEAAAAFISDAMSTMREKRALARERFDYLLNHSSREIDELIGEL